MNIPKFQNDGGVRKMSSVKMNIPKFQNDGGVRKMSGNLISPNASRSFPSIAKHPVASP
jgi:hypothetical protein